MIEAAKAGGDLPLGALGSGSDYTAFLQHLGIGSLDLGFGGEDQSDGSYHSVYDSFYHVTHFDDPGLVYGAALSKLVGRRRAPRRRRPARPGPLQRLRQCGRPLLTDIQKLAADQREKDRTLADLRREGDFTLAASPTDPIVAPRRPGHHAADRHAAAGECRRSSEARRERRRCRCSPARNRLPPATQARINASLAQIDQLLTRSRGPSRPAVVQEPDLRARHADRLRRQDPARRPRGHRAAPLRRCPRLCRAHRQGARGLCQPPRCCGGNGEGPVMNRHLTTGRMIELAAAVLLFAAGVYFYRRRDGHVGQLWQPGRGDPVRHRRDHGASTRWAGSIITRAQGRGRE